MMCNTSRKTPSALQLRAKPQHLAPLLAENSRGITLQELIISID